jgi:hypothetical protein
MDRRSWTELFFLDEAVTLAAGHHPCFFCRRKDAETFRAAWAKARGEKAPLAAEMDAALHVERLDHGHKRVHAISGPLGGLPDGAVVTAGGEAYTLARGCAFRWTEQGYEAAQQIPRADGLLTPPSTLLSMRAGLLAGLASRSRNEPYLIFQRRRIFDDRSYDAIAPCTALLPS